MKPSTITDPIRIHCEGMQVLAVSDDATGEVRIYASTAVQGPQLLVLLTHVAPDALQQAAPEVPESDIRRRAKRKPRPHGPS